MLFVNKRSDERKKKDCEDMQQRRTYRLKGEEAIPNQPRY